jgi:transposase
LTSAQHSSAGKEQRGPISKQRNRHLQTTLIEAAKLEPRYHPRLAAAHQRELQRGNRTNGLLIFVEHGRLPLAGRFTTAAAYAAPAPTFIALRRGNRVTILGNGTLGVVRSRVY